MKRWITGFAGLIIGFVCLMSSTTPLIAQRCGCCNLNWYLNGAWEVSAEVLCIRPCATEFPFAVAAIPTLNDPVVSRNVKSLKPDYEWAFRVEGAYYSCDGCDFFSLGWTHFDSRVLQKVFPPKNGQLTALFVPDETTPVLNVLARVRSRYDKIDFRAGRRVSCACRSAVYVYGGLRYIGIRENDDICALMNIDGQKQRASIVSRFEGLGLELGLSGQHDIGCHFSFVAQLGVVAALGDKRITTTLKNPFSTTVANARTTYPARTTCIPGIDWKLGLSYYYDFCCVRFIGELGYQMDYYFNALYMPRPAAATALQSAIVDWNVNRAFAGPYFALRAQF
jgi:hypothetical protein